MKCPACDDYPTPRCNLPEEDRLVRAMRETLAAAEAVRDAHDAQTEGDDGCDCCLCTDARGLIYNVTMAESVISSVLIPLPEEMTPEAIRAAIGVIEDAAEESDSPIIVGAA